MSLTGATLKRIVRILMERDGFRCHYCGVPLKENLPDGSYDHHGVSVDHVIPQTKGGTDEVGNLVLACRRCNSKKKTGDYSEFRLVTETDGIIRFMMEGDSD